MMPMLNNDLSNESPTMALVSVDCILKRNVEEQPKLLGIFSRDPRTNIEYDLRAINQFYRMAHRGNVTYELFAVGWTVQDMDEVERYLDRLGTDPFKWYTTYDNLQEFLAEVNFRRNVVGIIDKPENGLRYGRLWWNLKDIYGGGQ
jgi:hypothetical protein